MSEAMQTFFEEHGVRLGGEAGRRLPLGYGDFAGEAAAIEESLGVLVLEADSLLLVRGPDAAQFLHGVVTSDLKALPVGRAQYSLLCGNKGNILHQLTLLRIKEEEFLLLCQAGGREEVAARLDYFHIREELEIGAVEMLRVDLSGPLGAASLEQLGIEAGGAAGRFADGAVLAAPLEMGGLPHLLTLVPPQTGAQWAEALLSTAGEARLVGIEAWDEARIRAGVARWGVDYGPGDLPAEAALYDHISFQKGCYVGQEIHARMHYRGHPNRKLTGVTLPAEAGLAVGSQLFAGEESVGALTSLARQPREGLLRGIAMIRYQAVLEQVKLAAGPGGAAEIALHPLAGDLATTGSR